MGPTEISRLRLRALVKVRADSNQLTAPCQSMPPQAACREAAWHKAAASPMKLSERAPCCLRRTVFNVSLGREFYGSSGCYHCLAGRDASRLLAKGILVEESPDEALEPLSPDELESMRQWLELYEHKYEYLGPLLRDDGTAADDSGGATNLVVDSTGIRWRLVGGADHVNHENESHRESDKMN